MKKLSEYISEQPINEGEYQDSVKEIKKMTMDMLKKCDKMRYVPWNDAFSIILKTIYNYWKKETPNATWFFNGFEEFNDLQDELEIDVKELR